jgi:hypothetical protein
LRCARKGWAEGEGEVMAERTQLPEPNWSFELPDKLKLAIADCILLYSKIESCIVELVWLIEDADLERKREIAKGWGDQNFRTVKQVVKSIPGAESDAIWPALKDLGRERNLIGHGVWMMAESGRPMVVWHKFLESDEWVNTQYFDWERFDHFLAIGRVVLNAFAEFKRLLEEGIKTELAKRAAGGS